MRRLGRTTILECLTFSTASGVKLKNRSSLTDASGRNVVLNVEWLERSGDLVTLNSETWTPLSANIWLATSPKK